MSGAGEFSGTIAAGRYRLGRALGGGRVHEARHDRVGGRFALERFGDVDARAFLRGAQQAAALRHPGIVRVLDYGTSPEAFIVMEWAEGRPLTDLLAARGALAPGEIAHLVESVALGLQAAHRQGLAHGHLTPAHILVTDEAGGSGEALGGARTKLLGFGTGPTGALAPAVSLTEVTPYEAPESLDGEPTPLADQYSLAAITYELLTGEAPRADGRPPRSVREYDPTINVVIDDVVRRGLSVNPHARWPDVHTFAARLGEAALAEGVLEEKTRLAPLPLTVTKPMTPAPDDLTPIELPPVIASIDVDLRTPAPARRAPSFLEGEISMNPTHTRPPSSDQGLPGGPYPTRYPSRGPAPPHYGIRPTPTFNFTDEPAPGPLYKPRRRSGSGFGLFVLVLAGGVSGYLAVDTGVWRWSRARLPNRRRRPPRPRRPPRRRRRPRRA
jgi:serine/threonine-protein kinase